MRLLILSASFLLLSSVPVLAQGIDSVRCPNSVDGRTLSSYDVTYGPPTNKGYIIVDDEGWDLDSYRVKGFEINLFCRYGNVEKVVQVPKNIDRCTMYGNNVDCR